MSDKITYLCHAKNKKTSIMAKSIGWEAFGDKTKQLVDELTSAARKRNRLDIDAYLKEQSVQTLVMLQIRIGKLIQQKLAR